MILIAVVASALSSVGTSQIATARHDEQIKSLRDKIAILEAGQVEAVAERFRVRGIVADRASRITRLEEGQVALWSRLTDVEKEQARRTPYIPKKLSR
jgi:hypothetical protein